MRIHVLYALVALAALAAAGNASAQGRYRPQLYDIKLGIHINELPTDDWVDPACGTNGGPRRQLIGEFTNFAECSKEADTGLHEVWFSNDDEDELLARATHDPVMIQRWTANNLFNVPAIFSLLVDAAGVVQGYRIISDTRAPPAVRLNAFNMARPFKALSDMDETACTKIPPLEGERAVDGANGGPLTKEICTQVKDGRRTVVESRFFLKPGQSLIDPFTQQPQPNAFESFARLEVINAAALPRR